MTAAPPGGLRRLGFFAAVVAAPSASLLWGGCAFAGRRVALHYGAPRPSGAIRRTAMRVDPFLDKRSRSGSMGVATVGMGALRVPLRQKSDVRDWVRKAVSLELRAAGYILDSGSSAWTVGGTILEAGCGTPSRAECRVRLDIRVRMTDGWQVSRHEYPGEGIRPALLPGEDGYALSLEDALRDALVKFRRDLEITVP